MVTTKKKEMGMEMVMGKEMEMDLSMERKKRRFHCGIARPRHWC